MSNMVGTKTHAFTLMQGDRCNDTAFISSSLNRISVPTWHGRYLMRSVLETEWAKHFESRGYCQTGRGITESLPCYFYEPRGMKKWPGYPGGHYRIDFILVSAVKTICFKGENRSCATDWIWISVKPVFDSQDFEWLKELRAFDRGHHRAFQCIGNPSEHNIREVPWPDIALRL